MFGPFQKFVATGISLFWRRSTISFSLIKSVWHPCGVCVVSVLCLCGICVVSTCGICVVSVWYHYQCGICVVSVWCLCGLCGVCVVSV